MKTTVAALLLLAAFAGMSAHAQVRKCIQTDGKVVYSDALCTMGTAKEADVNLVAYSADKSPVREEARKFAMDRAIAKAREREPNKCKFSVEPSVKGDGKQLAEEATQECFYNILAARTGKPQQNEAFERWFENQQLASQGRRSASVTN